MTIDFYDKQPLCVINSLGIKKISSINQFCSPPVIRSSASSCEFWALVGVVTFLASDELWAGWGGLCCSLARVIYVTSIERLPICIMKCYKSVQNVESNGNIEMMYSSAELKAQARESEQEEGRNQPNTPGDGPALRRIICFYFFFLRWYRN